MFAERFTLPRDENGNPIPIPRRTDYLAIDSSKATVMSFEQSESLDISAVSYTHLDVYKRQVWTRYPGRS